MATTSKLEDIYEAQEILEEMQRDRDPDERTDFWGRPLRSNPDDTPEEE